VKHEGNPGHHCFVLFFLFPEIQELWRYSPRVFVYEPEQTFVVGMMIGLIGEMGVMKEFEVVGVMILAEQASVARWALY